MLNMFFGDWVTTLFTVGIMTWGVVILYKIMKTGKELGEHKDKLDDAVSVGRVRTELDENASLISYAVGNETPKEAVTEMHKEFFGICADNDVINQMIAILPSVGILGTVAGLMKQVAASGIEEMTGSIGLALGTTFLALFLTIAFKIVVTFYILKKVNSCEVTYDNYDRQRQDLRIENKQ